MKHKLAVVLLLLALVFLFTQAAGAQEEGTVRFQETTGVLDGQIHMVEPGSGLLIVERNSIPYSFNLTAATRISIRNRAASREELAARRGESVTVAYRATRRGNLASEVTVP